MPSFGPSSKKQYDTLHPNLQKVLDAVIPYFDFTITEGFRNKEDQNKAFAEGNSQKQWPNGEHNHLPSTAVDIYPFPVDWGSAEKNTQRSVLLAGLIIMAGHQLGISIRWGGDWNMNGDTRDEKFRDYGHFELAK